MSTDETAGASGDETTWNLDCQIHHLFWGTPILGNPQFSKPWDSLGLTRHSPNLSSSHNLGSWSYPTWRGFNVYKGNSSNMDDVIGGTPMTSGTSMAGTSNLFYLSLAKDRAQHMGVGSLLCRNRWHSRNLSFPVGGCHCSLTCKSIA